MHQVCLAKSDTSIDKKRVIGSCGGAGNRHGSCPGELVASSHHKILKGVLRIEEDAPVGETGSPVLPFCFNFLLGVITLAFKNTVIKLYFFFQIALNGFGNYLVIVVLDPLLEKPVGNLECKVLVLQVKKPDRFEPEFKRLVPHFFLYGFQGFLPCMCRVHDYRRIIGFCSFPMVSLGGLSTSY